MRKAAGACPAVRPPAIDHGNTLGGSDASRATGVCHIHPPCGWETRSLVFKERLPSSSNAPESP
jgi:hypothetical protein